MRRTAAATTFFSLAVSAVAGAESTGPGGVEAFGKPSISAVVCPAGDATQCPRGSELRIVGENLDGVERVRFLGEPGRADDRVARPRGAASREISVVVPKRTRSGPVEVQGRTGSARAASIRITSRVSQSADEPAAGAPADEAVFPIRGAHRYGDSSGRFGGGRSHQGQDVFAACGTPLVAAMSGRVVKSAFHGRAGNYLVIQHADGRSTAYMHLRSLPLAGNGDHVEAGDEIGEVGDSGRASGCHLHFELWTAPGWYRGGRAVDPLGALRAMDAPRAPRA